MADLLMLCGAAASELQERRKADSEREQVRSAHTEWSQATFGDVGPVGPLKHLSKKRLRLLLSQATLANGLTCSSCYGMRNDVPVSVMSRLP